MKVQKKVHKYKSHIDSKMYQFLWKIQLCTKMISKNHLCEQNLIHINTKLKHELRELDDLRSKQEVKTYIQIRNEKAKAKHLFNKPKEDMEIRWVVYHCQVGNIADSKRISQRITNLPAKIKKLHLICEKNDLIIMKFVNTRKGGNHTT